MVVRRKKVRDEFEESALSLEMNRPIQVADATILFGAIEDNWKKNRVRQKFFSNSEQTTYMLSAPSRFAAEAPAEIACEGRNTHGGKANSFYGAIAFVNDPRFMEDLSRFTAKSFSPRRRVLADAFAFGLRRNAGKFGFGKLIEINLLKIINCSVLLVIGCCVLPTLSI